MYRSAATRALVPAAVVTRIALVPVPRGVTAVQVVLEVQCTEVMSTPPIRIAVTPSKLRPVIVTVVPPRCVPLAGLMRVTTGFAATVAVPVTGIDAVPEALSRVSVVLTGPAAVGAKATVAAQCAPGATVAQDVTSSATMPLLAPAPVVAQVAFPVLVRVTDRRASEPTGTLPNATGLGLGTSVLVAATPVPATPTVAVTPPALNAMAVVSWPAPVGANATVIGQLAPGAREGHCEVSRETAGAPLVASIADHGTVPVLVSVSVWVAADPTTTSLKRSRFVLAERPGTARTTKVLTGWLIDSSHVPVPRNPARTVRSPRVVGVKVQLAVPSTAGTTCTTDAPVVA